MNDIQIGGMIRVVMGAISGVCGVLGIMKGVDWVAVTSAMVAFGTLGWSYFAHTTPKMLDAMAKSPEVKKVVTTPAMAMATKNTKVVASPDEPLE
jgi:hypothetical protein